MGHSKLLYALDEKGRYVPAPSNGWEAEEIVLDQAIAEYQRQAADAWARACAGTTGALEYHMFRQRMDVVLLSQTTGYFKWQVRRASAARRIPEVVHIYTRALRRSPGHGSRGARYPAGTAVNAAALPGDVEISFDHQQSAHCESGAISSLLRNRQLALSRAHGLRHRRGPGLRLPAFPDPFGGLPLFAYRMPPGFIIRSLTKRLGIKMHTPDLQGSGRRHARALDRHLAAGRAVGIQTSAYWLPYFPPDMRFHFNAHNILVHGKRGDDYLVSDPVIDILVECDAPALKKARFTRGVLAPKGMLYYPEHIPEHPDLRQGHPQGHPLHLRHDAEHGSSPSRAWPASAWWHARSAG